LYYRKPSQSDFDGDFQSGPEDVLPFAAVFGAVSGGSGFDPTYDANGNGVVDFFDFLTMLELWGS